jgi:hypothetical protein
MTTSVEVLHPARLKIHRAEHHINDLNGQIEAFLAERPFKLIEHHKPKRRELTFKTKAEKSIPEHFALIIGDAVHNLRSALDLTVYALASEKSPSPHKIEFPFPLEAQRLESAIDNGQVRFAGEKVVEAVRALHPYPGGNALLCALHRINARDKHRLPILTGYQARITVAQISRLYPGMPFLTHPADIEAFTFTHAESDNLITLTDMTDYGDRNTRRRTPDFEQEAKFQPAYSISLGKGQPFEGEPVIPLLVSMGDAVSTAVTRLVEAAFGDG